MQSPSFRARGIGRYAQSWAEAIERTHPDLVRVYLLNPDLAPPSGLDTLATSGKLRYRDADDAAVSTDEIHHVLAPIDLQVPLATLWPTSRNLAGRRRTATVYDCIPALDLGHELRESAQRSAYAIRFECLRAADQLHVLSEAVASDVRRCLGPAHPPLRVVGAAPAPAFVPSDDPVATRARVALALPSLRGRFVLYPTGSHPRKNNERLVEAWCALASAQRGDRQLVLTGELPPSTVHHLEHLAAAYGASGSVIATGYVDDGLLLGLYQSAELVCFPSLAEGFGLPIAEAIACGTPVIASNRSPMADLVGPRERFDPEDIESITSSLRTALDQPCAPDDEAAGPRPVTWDVVAARSAAAFAELFAGVSRQRARRSDRLRLGFVSPLPPAPTGVAAYSYRLLEELAAIDALDVDAFVDGPTADQLAPPGMASYRARSLCAIDAAIGGYDHVIYALGNSHHHLGALAMLRRREGSVIAHDVRLSNLYRHESGDPGLLPGGLGRKIAELYGTTLPEGIGDDGDLHFDDEERYGVVMAREVVRLSQRFLVSSAAARELAILDAGSELGRRVGVLPFAFDEPVADPNIASSFGASTPAPPAGNDRVLRYWGKDANVAGSGSIVVAHFGIVDPVKEPALLLEAVAHMAEGGTGSAASLLVFVGPISDALVAELAAHAHGLGVSEQVCFTGPLSGDAYRSWLRRADIAIQLRRRTNGEASAAIGECLASGCATIVSDLGWAHELSEEVVMKVPAAISARDLAALLMRLVENDGQRGALALAARAEAERRSFSATAAALLSLLSAPEPHPSDQTWRRSSRSGQRCANP